MKSIGLNPTMASGSWFTEKEDGQNEHIIAQLKSTDANSIGIKLQDICALEYNAGVAHKIPIFIIQFLKSNDIFILTRLSDINDVAKYIKTGNSEKRETIEVETTAVVEKKQIKSGNRSKFWNEKEKERIKWQKK